MGKSVSAASCTYLILFCDIRGFTTWTENATVAGRLSAFINDFHSLFKTHFFDANGRKALGDGMMLFWSISDDAEIDIPTLFQKAYSAIQSFTTAFNERLTIFAHRYGVSRELKLGWGFTRGDAVRIKEDNRTDLIGSQVNKASRLCDLARPFGIVVDREDFPELPEALNQTFSPKLFWLKGYDKAVEAWVTPEIAHEFINRESGRETPEVHVAGACYRKAGDTWKVLIAKRNENRRLYPGLYEGCGGQLAHNEEFQAGVKRHFSAELGITINVLADHLLYTIKEPNEAIIPGIRFYCIHEGGEATSSNHSELRWVTKDELEAMPESAFIEGLHAAFREGFDIVLKRCK